jgi:hypothetical protein
VFALLAISGCLAGAVFLFDGCTLFFLLNTTRAKHDLEKNLSYVFI